MQKKAYLPLYLQHLARSLPAALLATQLGGLGALAAQENAPAEVKGGQAGGEQAAAPNPFEGFETHYLSNGVRVWFKRLHGSLDAYVGAGIPAGGYAAPPGKADLAHFVEHMLLTDRDGRTEVENRAAIEERGGRVVAFTSRERTWFSVSIGRSHAPLAIEWLAGVLAPRQMEPELVERNRLPIELELGVRRPDMLSAVVGFLTPSRLEVPLFWEREFGPDWERHARGTTWRSLYSITPDDLQWFYDRYYAPGHMTVLVVGDMERDEALAAAERTFGSLPARPVTRWDPALVDPGRGRGEYEWRFASPQMPRTFYRLRYKLYDPSADEQLMAYFIADLLSFRINDRLRFGESKVAYSAGVSVDQRGNAATLWVRVLLTEGGLAYAREAVHEEIRRVRTGALDADDFESTRARVLEATRSASLTAGSLAALTVDRFFYPGIFPDVPDLLSFFGSVTQDQVTRYAEQLFAESNRVELVTREPPISPFLAALSALALLALTLAFAKREPRTPLHRREIIYIARLRLPITLSAGYGIVLAVVVFVLVVTGGAALRWAAVHWLWPIDSFALQAGAHAVVLVLVFAGLCRLLSLVPHELVVASGQLRVLSRTWRSRVLDRADIAEISTCRFREVWLGRRLLRGLPLTWGIAHPGIFLQPKRGRAYFFGSRNTGELAAILDEWSAPPDHSPLDSPLDLRPAPSGPKLDADPVPGVPA